MNLNKLTLSELLSLYEACNLVYEFYDNQAKTNESEKNKEYLEGKEKRNDAYKRSRKIFNMIEEIVGEVTIK